MKILFESTSGKQTTKEFKTISEAKQFVIKNKSNIKYGQIMEGPLGSGSLNPIKGLKRLKRGFDKKKEYNELNNIKYSPKRTIVRRIQELLDEISHDESTKYNANMNRYVCKVDEYGYYIDKEHPNIWSNARDIDDGDKKRSIKFTNKKYGDKLYMPKLTKYIEKHHSLPSDEQLRAYLANIIDNRYKQNFDK